MAEYIERKALLDELCRDNCERTYDGTCHNCRMTETVADFPAVDVAPVVHGRWEHDEMYEDWADQYLCSVCKCHALTNGDYMHKLSVYCPSCGARMDLDTADDV